MKKTLFYINPEPSHDFRLGRFDRERTELWERAKNNEKVRKRIEEICLKEFIHDLEKNYLVKELCQKNYQPETIKDFKKLEIKVPQLFFDNLFKYIDKLGSAKDILIIADRKTYRFIKQNETGKFLENYVGNLLEANLENNIRLIMTSQKGLLIPYSVECFDYNNTHYLRIHHEIDLIDNNPIVIFKEES